MVVQRITADVTDDNPAKTNTGQSFSAGDEIAWNGANWTELGSTDIWKEDISKIETVSNKYVTLTKLKAPICHGIVTKPTITDNSDDTVSIGTGVGRVASKS